MFTYPCLCHRASRVHIVDNQDQAMIVIAVKRFNIDTRQRHASRNFSQLPGLILIEPLH